MLSTFLVKHMFLYQGTADRNSKAAALKKTTKNPSKAGQVSVSVSPLPSFLSLSLSLCV